MADLSLTTRHTLAAEPGTSEQAPMFALGAAMIILALLACVVIVEGSVLWLVVACGMLLGMLAGVGAFLAKSIDSGRQ